MTFLTSFDGVGNPPWQIWQDGSASFASGALTFNNSGDISMGLRLNLGGGSATIEASGGGDTLTLITANDINLNPDGKLMINSVEGLTRNVTVAGTTFHYTKGILTSVT